MSFPRLSMTTNRGVSLIELIVSVSIFLGLMSVVFGLLYQNQKASEKSIVQADSSSVLLILFEKIRAEMRNGRVVANDPPESLDYWIYERENGLPKFGGPHGLIYLPGPNADPDVATLRLEEGRLVRDFQDQKKIFVSMGAEGSITFRWGPGTHTLLVSGQVQSPAPDERSVSPPRKFNFLLSLNNVE